MYINPKIKIKTIVPKLANNNIGIVIGIRESIDTKIFCISLTRSMGITIENKTAQTTAEKYSLIL